MALLINLRHLEKNAVQLNGQLPASELELADVDEMIQANQPLEYELEAEKLEEGILVRGELRLVLDCECVRCLKPFQIPLDLESWACHLPLEGEEKAVVDNDCVDLTPYIREDILLEFPQHPLCRPECGGLQKKPGGKKKDSNAGQAEDNASAWTELNKLKF